MTYALRLIVAAADQPAERNQDLLETETAGHRLRKRKF